MVVTVHAAAEHSYRSTVAVYGGECWDRLSYSHQRENVEAVTGAKKPETRLRRVRGVIDRLS